MELGKIVRFRNIWVGVAMLWIIFYYSGFGIESGLLVGTKNIGYGGVDICLSCMPVWFAASWQNRDMLKKEGLLYCRGSFCCWTGHAVEMAEGISGFSVVMGVVLVSICSHRSRWKLVCLRPCRKMEKYRVGRKMTGFLQSAGVYSFELYLVPVFLYEGLMSKIKSYFYNVPNNLLWLSMIPAVVGGAYLLNRLPTFVFSFVEDRIIRA